jgi:hypothetical protein
VSGTGQPQTELTQNADLWIAREEEVQRQKEDPKKSPEDLERKRQECSAARPNMMVAWWQNNVPLALDSAHPTKVQRAEQGAIQDAGKVREKAVGEKAVREKAVGEKAVGEKATEQKQATKKVAGGKRSASEASDKSIPTDKEVVQVFNQVRKKKARVTVSGPGQTAAGRATESLVAGLNNCLAGLSGRREKSAGGQKEELKREFQKTFQVFKKDVTEAIEKGRELQGQEREDDRAERAKEKAEYLAERAKDRAENHAAFAAIHEDQAEMRVALTAILGKLNEMQKD